jgi:hypothetical protein
MSLFSSSSPISGERGAVCIIGSHTFDDDPAAGPVDPRASTALRATAVSSPPIAPKFNLLINYATIYLY